MSEHVIEVTENRFETEVLQSDKAVLVDFWDSPRTVEYPAGRYALLQFPDTVCGVFDKRRDQSRRRLIEFSLI